MKEHHDKIAIDGVNRNGLLERVEGLMGHGRFYNGIERERSVTYHGRHTPEDTPDYFEFYNEFRSSPEDVKKHQSRFIKYFKGCKQVLDIGCGRGEFLELLKDEKIGGYGVDMDQEMVDLCLSKRLSVKKIDAISYLKSLKDGALDGIFTDDVVEHLDANYLYKMLKLCARKLQKGRHMVIVTVNPLSWVTFSNIFYVDLTHKKPIHPEAMIYIMKDAGFESVEVKFVSMLPEREKLSKIEIEPSIDNGEKKRLETYNHNVEMLNDVLFGPENYAAIAKK